MNKPSKYKSKTYTDSIKELPCILCEGKEPVEFYRLSYSGNKAAPLFKSKKNGKIRQISRCTDCAIKRTRERFKKFRISPIGKSNIDKGKIAENLAKKKIEELGFKIEETPFHGPDIICSIGDWRITIEVKTVFRDKKNKTYKTGAICPRRVNDDLVALVLPNKRVYIDSMENHLKNCTKIRTRSITPIVKQIGLN